MKQFKVFVPILVIIFFCICSLKPTFAKFVSTTTTDDEIMGINFSYDIGINNLEEYNEIKVNSRSVSSFNVEVNNISDSLVYYGVWYKIVGSKLDKSQIKVARYDVNDTVTSGAIAKEEVKTISIVIINNSYYDIKVNIGVSSSEEGTDAISYTTGNKLIADVASTSDISTPNRPNLVEGMIPVYYDEGNNIWRKADTENINNVWYDYASKKWANAILVSDNTSNMYKSALKDTAIKNEDIMAFYVWIPRFKYRVFNITRNVTGEDGYVYPALSKGIQIIFETDNNNSGNVKCSYTNLELADSCSFAGATVLTTDSNEKYSNAWYTHPAFTFGSRELTGFWIGKYETSGSLEAPLVLPSRNIISNKNISSMFSSSKLWQLSINSKLDSHITKNIEYGALLYLTNSVYGICDGEKCNNIDSYSSITGESIVDGKAYLYNGFSKDDEINKTGDISSSTGNIYGVYDLNNNNYEVVMANMKSNVNYISFNKSGFSDNNVLDQQYLDLYKYLSPDDSTTKSIAILGDATGEVNQGINQKSIDVENSWYIRGNGLFGYSSYNGDESEKVTYRSVIS